MNMLKELQHLPLEELRQRWTTAWGKEPHKRIGRTMLERSLVYKTRQQQGRGLTPEQQVQLGKLMKEYKRNPARFDERSDSLKPGTKLIRTHNGKKHSVLVKATGFEYEGQTYGSLSKIANDITGKRWNGWVFFGIKK